MASSDKPDSACVFPSPGCLGMGKGYFEKVVRGLGETRTAAQWGFQLYFPVWLPQPSNPSLTAGAFAGCEEDEIVAYGPDGRMMGRFDSLFSLEFVRSDFVASSIPVILSDYKGGLVEVYGKFPLPR